LQKVLQDKIRVGHSPDSPGPLKETCLRTSRKRRKQTIREKGGGFFLNSEESRRKIGWGPFPWRMDKTSTEGWAGKKNGEGEKHQEEKEFRNSTDL